MSIQGSYSFEPRCLLALAPWEAEALAEGRPLRRAGHGAQRVVTLEAGPRGALVEVREGPCEGLRLWFSSSEALEAAGERGVALVLPGGRVERAEVRGRGYYRLVATRPGGYPTLEINGIHMHRVWGTDPRLDTIAKIRAARIRRGHRVLDTCMGLGYTAIHSVLAGARLVVTVEVDPSVVELARANPWSWGLGRPEIVTVRGDAVEIIRGLEPESFDRIIHDPPRIGPSTGDLYGREFYRSLYRLLRHGGILFHYTGEPGRKHGRNFPGRVASRLREAGFARAWYDKRAQGVVAVKA